MNKLNALRGLAEIMVTIGVNSMVGNALKLVVDPNAGKLKKACVFVGGIAISGLVSDAAVKYTDNWISSSVDTFGKFLTPPVVDVPPVEDPTPTV